VLTILEKFQHVVERIHQSRNYKIIFKNDAEFETVLENHFTSCISVLKRYATSERIIV